FPTPAAAMTANSILNTLTIKVDRIYTTCIPSAIVMLTGTVATTMSNGPLGNVAGAPAAVSLELSNGSPTTTPGGTGGTTSPSIINVVALVAGKVVEVTGTASGAITFAGSALTPPGSTGGPSIVVTPIGLTAFRQVDLDASATSGGTPPLT